MHLPAFESEATAGSRKVAAVAERFERAKEFRSGKALTMNNAKANQARRKHC